MPQPVTKQNRLTALYNHIASVPLPTVSLAKKMSAGNPDSPLMIVFSHALVDLLGAETAFLNFAFASAEIDKRNVFFSYAIRGTLLKVEKDGSQVMSSRDASEFELDVFRPFLLEEIHIVRPKAILCVGSTSIKTLLGDPHFSILKMAGAELEVPGVDCPVIATISQTYVLRMGGARSKASKQFIADLKRAKELSESSEV